MGYYRKKSLVISARQFRIMNYRELQSWTQGRARVFGSGQFRVMRLDTGHGFQNVAYLDWIVQPVPKVLDFLCIPDAIFRDTYELVINEYPEWVAQLEADEASKVRGTKGIKPDLRRK